MKLKLLGERIAVLPDDSDEKTQSGIILSGVKSIPNSNIKRGVVSAKGTGTPWNRMEDIHVKQFVYYKKGSGIPHEEEKDGRMVKYLILSYQEILFEP